MAVYEGCCGGPDWRGLNCAYHEGYEDGVDDERDRARAREVERDELARSVIMAPTPETERMLTALNFTIARA